MQQEIFPIKYKNKYVHEDFIVSVSNQDAHNAVQNPQTNWGFPPYPNSLLIYAPPSSGKTYLAKILSNNINTKFILPNESLGGDVVMRYNAFVIDNFNQSWEEEEVLHHFNLLREHNKLFLITSSYDINHIALPDLASRIKSIRSIHIGMLDDNFVEMFIFKQFANHSIKIPPSTVKYLVNHIPRECGKIIKIIEQINQHAMRTKKKITIKSIKELNLFYSR